MVKGNDANQIKAELRAGLIRPSPRGQVSLSPETCRQQQAEGSGSRLVCAIWSALVYIAMNGRKGR